MILLEINKKFIYVTGVNEVSYTMTPPYLSWGNRFIILDDRGRVNFFKFLARYEAFLDE